MDGQFSDRLTRGISRKGRAALAATLISQLGKSPELTKVVILLIALGHIRMRSGYMLVDSSQPHIPARHKRRGARGKGFTVKRPRSRFL
jgi:hypothetical protein